MVLCFRNNRSFRAVPKIYSARLFWKSVVVTDFTSMMFPQIFGTYSCHRISPLKQSLAELHAVRQLFSETYVVTTATLQDLWDMPTGYFRFVKRTKRMMRFKQNQNFIEKTSHTVDYSSKDMSVITRTINLMHSSRSLVHSV